MTKSAILTSVAAVIVPGIILALIAADLTANADGVLTLDEIQAQFPMSRRTRSLQWI